MLIEWSNETNWAQYLKARILLVFFDRKVSFDIVCNMRLIEYFPPFAQSSKLHKRGENEIEKNVHRARGGYTHFRRRVHAAAIR